MDIKENSIEETWKRSKSVTGKEPGLDKDKLSDLLERKPRDMYRKIAASVYLNIALKQLFIFSQFILLYLLSEQVEAVILILVMIAGGLLLLLLDVKLLKKIRKNKSGDLSLSENLKSLHNFLKSDFHFYRVYAAIVNPILIITGTLFYGFFKYDRTNLFDSLENIIVFAGFALAGYLVSLIGNNYSAGQMEKEVDVYISQLDASIISKEELKKLREKKIRNTIVMVIILVLGLLLFILIRNI